ncbi:hypothetical protein [Ralstonia pseudosolanacearum]|uniref:hypothetical protein n=1 Tax=Ralstonia pseudosolanacearum TaxID=1310165 RepID=UPI003CF1E685
MITRELTTHTRAEATEQPTLEDFKVAVRVVAARIGAKDVNAAGTPISAFKTNYASILKRVKEGSFEVVKQGKEPFVILGLKQFVALATDTGRGRTVAEVFAGLPSVPATEEPPRFTSIQTKSQYRVPR